MTNPMDDLRQASAEVSGVEVLSPAAQAVMDAYIAGLASKRRNAIAAALRAAADQVVPEENPPWKTKMHPWQEERFEQRQVTRRSLMAIAAELEGAQ